MSMGSTIPTAAPEAIIGINAMPRSRSIEFSRAWKVLLAATVGVGLGTTGLPFYSFGLFIRPLGQDFGWSRGAISFGISCLSLGIVLTSPLIGRLVDTFGVRKVATLSQIGLALGFLGVSFVGPSLTGFYLAWLALSFLGSGTSPIVWTRAVAGWFELSRGLALGIMLCGTGLVALLGSPLIGHLIAAYGWRVTYRVLAAVLLFVAVPITVTMLRSGRTDATKAVSETGFTLGEAFRSSAFWRIEIAFLCISTVMGGAIVHLAPMLIDRGATPTDAAATVGYLGYAIIVGRLSLGAMVDRFAPALVGAGLILLAAFASIMLANSIAPLPATLLLGLCAGAEVDLLAFLISRLFGLKHYSQIYGWGISAFTAGAALGPVVAGRVHDLTGSYGAALYGFAVVIVVASALIASLHGQVVASKVAVEAAHG